MKALAGISFHDRASFRVEVESGHVVEGNPLILVQQTRTPNGQSKYNVVL
jgi:hypothetical protein